MFCSHEKFNPRLLCLIPAKMDFLAHPLPLQGRSAFPLPGDPHGHSGQVRIRPRCDPQEAWSIPRSLPLSPMPEKVVHPHRGSPSSGQDGLCLNLIYFFSGCTTQLHVRLSQRAGFFPFQALVAAWGSDQSLLPLWGPLSSANFPGCCHSPPTLTPKLGAAGVRWR